MLDELQLDLPSGLDVSDVDHLARKAMIRGANALTPAEKRALGESTGTNVTQNGFYLAPSQFSRECFFKIRALNPIRKHGARVFRDCGYSLSVPTVLTDIDAQRATRNAVNALPMSEYTTTPTFAQPRADEAATGRVLYPRAMYVYFRASLELLQDTTENNGPNLERLLGDMAAQAFAQQEVDQMLKGTSGDPGPMNAVNVGLLTQLSNAARVSGGVGATSGSFTSLEFGTILENLSSGRYARAIHIWHPRMLGILNASFDPLFAGSAQAQAKADSLMLLAGRPLYLEPLALSAASFATSAVAGLVIDPTAFVFAESGPPVALRRLDELGAATGEVLFQAVRRVDFALADMDAAYGIRL
jgi:HK97 family phage major capsid protein